MDSQSHLLAKPLERTTTPYEPITPAKTAVLSTVELVDAILSHLSTSDILRTTQVNKSFLSVLSRSTAVRKRLFDIPPDGSHRKDIVSELYDQNKGINKDRSSPWAFCIDEGPMHVLVYRIRGVGSGVVTYGKEQRTELVFIWSAPKILQVVDATFEVEWRGLTSSYRRTVVLESRTYLFEFFRTFCYRELKYAVSPSCITSSAGGKGHAHMQQNFS